MEIHQDFPKNPEEIEAFLRFWHSQDLAKLRPIVNAIVDHQQQDASRHDLWSAYVYGGELKVVFLKALPKKKTTAAERAFEALEQYERECNYDADKVREKIADHYKRKSEKKERETSDGSDRFRQSLSRSRARVFELAACNEFQYFGTFTLDEKMRDRFNLADFRKAFAQYVRNLNRSRPAEKKIKYLMIPEQHKDGAWHMHGLLLGLGEEDLRAFNLSEKIPERIKRQIRKGETVYDWTGYRDRFGYFTATAIKNPEAVSKYITKYLTKDIDSNARESGEHLFFASQGLKGRTTLVKNRFGRCPVESWDFENDYVKTATFKTADIPKKLLSEILDTEN